MANYSKEIIKLVQAEKKNYEDASQEIRENIKKARKNYACKFDNPKTSAGRKKTFVPMTRWEVDTIAPKIFVNDKAVTVLPENEEAVRSAFIADKVLKYQIKETRFPTYFRNSVYDLATDGTTVFALFWNFEREIIEPKGFSEKVKKMLGKGSKPKTNVLKDSIGFKQIDLLNCYIDPTADSIQDSPSFIYKNIMPLEQAKRNRQYKNTDKLKGFRTRRIDEYDASSVLEYEIGKQDQRYEQDMVELTERWGRFPMSWLTKRKSDEGIMIDGVITLGDLDGKPIVLRVEKNPFHHGYKPFEECWYQKKIGRWYGIGIAEKLIELQSYINKVVNRQEENEDILHSGLFKKKRGSGISTKSIRSVPGGVIEVDNMDDLEQLQIRDISQLGNSTIQRIEAFVQRINGASEVAVGSSADRSATTSLIKDRNADTRFAAVRGYLNDFLVRFFKQWLALDRQFLDKKFVVRVTGGDSDLEEIDRVLQLPEEAAGQLSPQTGRFRFIEVDPKTIRKDFDLEVDIDQSLPMNKAEHSQRILNALQLSVQLGLQRDPELLFDAYLDTIGLQGSRFKTRRPPAIPGQIPGAGGQGIPQQTELQQFQEANIPPQTDAIVNGGL